MLGKYFKVERRKASKLWVIFLPISYHVYSYYGTRHQSLDKDDKGTK